MKPAGIVLTLALLAAPAAQGAPAPVQVDFEGCSELLDTDETLVLLRLELPAAGPPALALRALGAPETPPALAITVHCQGTEAVRIVVGADAAEPLPLADLAPRARARTLALALAERLRRAERERGSASASPAAAPPPIATAPAVSARAAAPSIARRAPVRNASRMRIAGRTALGLFVPSITLFAVGSPLAGVGNADPARAEYRVASAWLLSAAALTLGASAVSFGIWLHERRRPPATQRP